jgi:hypothetical protein
LSVRFHPQFWPLLFRFALIFVRASMISNCTGDCGLRCFDTLRSSWENRWFPAIESSVSFYPRFRPLLFRFALIFGRELMFSIYAVDCGLLLDCASD